MEPRSERRSTHPALVAAFLKGIRLQMEKDDVKHISPLGPVCEEPAVTAKDFGYNEIMPEAGIDDNDDGQPYYDNTTGVQLKTGLVRKAIVEELKEVADHKVVRITQL